MHDLKSYCGIVAGTCTTLSFLPQLIKVWKTKSTHDISSFMFAIYCVGVSLWLVYGFMLDDMPIIVSNIVTLTFAMAILVLKFKYN